MPSRLQAVPDWTRNGYAGPGFLFCQGIDEATICVPAPPGTRARDVVVSINQAGLLTVSLSGSKVLARTVAYEVVGMAVSAATRTLAPSRDSDEEADGVCVFVCVCV